MVKLLAMYLPQFHEIKQNNEWWEKGFTEWTHLKRAEPYYKNHYQPRVPLNGYYDLANKEVMEQQAKLAVKYGIYGFCFYHYWFEGVQIMEKPVDTMLMNPNVDIKFCLSWANHTWTKRPGKGKKEVLIRQTYGDKDDWIRHFRYLSLFFRDDRYIKINNKPMLVIYNIAEINCFHEMRKVWDDLAAEEGFDGIYYVATLKGEEDVIAANENKMDAQFEYQPTFGIRRQKKINYALWYQLKYTIINLKFLGRMSKFNYDRVWKNVIKNSIAPYGYKGITTYLGAFNDWDTTPRWRNWGHVFHRASPKKFSKFLLKQINRSKSISNSDFLFITAWNEWSEGAYLEPDKKYKYQYLEAVRKALKMAE